MVKDENLSLFELYTQIKHKILIDEQMSNFDRNGGDFEGIFRKMSSNRVEQLTVGHAKAFSLCTSNMDPGLRRIAREQRGSKIDIEQTENGEEIDHMSVLREIVGDAEFLFNDLAVWMSISKTLPKMSTGFV